MKSHPFTRITLIAAVNFLGTKLTQAKFDQAMLWLELENDVVQGTAKSVAAKAVQLGTKLTRDGDIVVNTLEGPMTLAEATVRQAVLAIGSRGPGEEEEATLLRALALDGYVVTKEPNGKNLLRSALPTNINLPEIDDELHILLKRFGFNTALSHLNQAIDAHTRGDWAAANSQIRTFLEGMLDEIAFHIDPVEASNNKTAENRRQMLASKGFLWTSKNEMTNDGKSFINGLFKMLHTDGSHPGLSDDDHCTFRLHLGLITGRTLMRRLERDRVL